MSIKGFKLQTDFATTAAGRAQGKPQSTTRRKTHLT
jgi:hypothetical protein